MESGRVNGTVMSGAFEVEFVGEEDRIDATFPQFTQFRMALECVKTREHLRMINFLASLPELPVSVGIVNGHISRYHSW